MVSAPDRQQKSSRRTADQPAARQRDWRNWRPTPHAGLLYLSIVLLVAWLGFLASMIRL